MSTPYNGFIGPSYHYLSKYAAVERTVGYYLVANEAPQEESKFKFEATPAPGNQAFCTLPVPAPFNQPNRALLELRGVAYGVNGDVAFSIDENGAFTNLGQIADDGLPASMVANGNGQIWIASGGLGYVIPKGGGAGSLIQVPLGNFLGASYSTFQDGYILSIVPNSNKFQISGSDDVPLGDATQWDASNVSVQAGQADNLRTIISSREYVRIMGHRRSQIYQDVGSQGIGAFPFVSYNETFIETGIAANFSLVDMGDSLIWIGEDSRGTRACWRDSAFQPQRISTFAIEQFWQKYACIDDAVAFPYIWNGHLFYRITFPSAYKSQNGVFTAATWEYDATVSALVQRPIWNELQHLGPLGTLIGRPELFHCYVYGKHLVGSGGSDGNPGAIYQLADAPWTDCGTDGTGAQVQKPMVRDRIAPHIFNSNHRIAIDRIEFELTKGAGLSGSPDVGVDPMLLLRISRDAGNTFGVEYNLPMGLIGEYQKLCFLNRCGSARDFVFWTRDNSPNGVSLISASVNVRECAS